MRIAALSRNLLTGGTITTAAAAFERAAPASNLLTLDPRQRAVWRGGFLVVATPTGSDKIDFTVGGTPKVATLTDDTYSPTERAQHVAARLSAADGVTWHGWWSQGSTNRYRFTCQRSSGTASLDLATGPNAARSALRKVDGFRGQDRAAAQTHTGDYAAKDGVQGVSINVASPQHAAACFLVGVTASPGLVGGVVTDGAVRWQLGEYDPELMAAWAPTPTLVSTAQLSLSDAWAESPQRIGASYWYLGPVWDSDRAGDAGRIDWEWSTYSVSSILDRTEQTSSTTGKPFFVERKPGARFGVAFRSAPGLSPAGASAFRDLILELGRTRLAVVALDPVGEPQRETRLCRIAPPPFSRAPVCDPDGRWSASIECEWVRVT